MRETLLSIICIFIILFVGIIIGLVLSAKIDESKEYNKYKEDKKNIERDIEIKTLSCMINDWAKQVQKLRNEVFNIEENTETYRRDIQDLKDKFTKLKDLKFDDDILYENWLNELDKEVFLLTEEVNGLKKNRKKDK